MSRRAILLVVTLLLLTPMAVLRGQEEAPEEKPALVVLHTNDIHGQMDPYETKKGPRGGILALSKTLDRIRKTEEAPTILLDGGDWYSGHPVANFTWKDVKGGAVIAMLNRLGYDATVLGNHEFDFGRETLTELLHLMKTRALCANLSVVGPPILPVYRVRRLERNGMRVSVIGLVTEELLELVGRQKTKGVQPLSAVEVAQELARRERKRGADLIVALTHLGVNEDIRLAEAVPELDLVVGGHSHTALFRPITVEGTMIVQAGAKGGWVGRVPVYRTEEGGVRIGKPDLVDVVPQPDVSTDPELEKLVRDFGKKIEAELGQEIGRLVHDWRRSYYEISNIGRWLADALRRELDGDVGILNAGGIRKNLAAGPITKGDIVEILPFRNEVASFWCNGAELIEMCRHNARAQATKSHGILQLGNLSYEWRALPEARKIHVQNVRVGGEPVDPNKTYHCVTNSFILYSQAKKYLGFEPNRTRREGVILQDVAIEAVKKTKTIESPEKETAVEVD